MASIALFAALGGGYAVAFKGSGTLQKGGVFGLPNSTTYTTIRVLTGIGRIEARCIQGTDAALDLNLHISGTFPADEGAIYRKDTLGGDDDSGSIPPGGDLPSPFEVSAGSDLTRLYVGTNEDDGGEAGFKRPQADIEIATHEAGGGSGCNLSRVEVLALNTQD